jgi:hypothetical protein
MPHLLFKLNGVPEDELIEVRRLLDEHQIHYYETDAGRFGISLAAIWLRDDGEIERARELLDTYQQQRYQQAREAYEQQLRDGTAETLLQRLWRQPLRSLLFIIAIIVVLYLSTMPFVMWLK